MNKSMKTQAQRALATLCIIAAIFIASACDKETLLLECVQDSGGTDSDCRECYIKVYGNEPSDNECLQRHY